MFLQKEILDFKESRMDFKKTSLHVSVNGLRLENICNNLKIQSDYFRLLSKSEQIDFCLYVLERFMANSDQFQLTTIQDQSQVVENTTSY